MPSMKCIECGIGFFSVDGGNKCSKCRPHESHMSEDNGGCGCGGHSC